jgi:hypothetical protein
MMIKQRSPGSHREVIVFTTEYYDGIDELLVSSRLKGSYNGTYVAKPTEYIQLLYSLFTRDFTFQIGFLASILQRLFVVMAR